jgi:hypothetical protein
MDGLDGILGNRIGSPASVPISVCCPTQCHRSLALRSSGVRTQPSGGQRAYREVWRNRVSAAARSGQANWALATLSLSYRDTEVYVLELVLLSSLS